jgi:predicted Zn-dependent peptidase
MAPAVAQTGDAIPKHPNELVFEPISFDVPDAQEMRFKLVNGLVVYAKEDTQLPLLSLTLMFRGGKYLEPGGKEGLTAITEEAWRTGGAGERTARELDEELDFLAANLSTSIGDTTGQVRLDILSKDLEVAMAILMDVITQPRFQQDRFDKAKDDMVQYMKTRNDSIGSIESREWDRLIYGEGYWVNRLPTKASVDAITVADCQQLVSSLIRADNMVVAVAGDFERQALKGLLNRTIGTLSGLDQPLPEMPQPDHAPEPGVYIVNKTDVNQGRVTIGHLGAMMGDPNEFPLSVMNEIMGGGFTSRTMQRVRSDEGLSYGARTSLPFSYQYPGTFRASLQTKFSTCPFATQIILDIFDDMRTENVSAEELTTAQTRFVEMLPRRFESAARTAALFAYDELVGQPSDYWQSYRDKVKAVTADQVRAAASAFLQTDKMIVLIVGDIEEIKKGHPDHEVQISDFGPIKVLPLRDPLTLEPLTDS